jgi:hypothetical protein
MTDKQAYYVVLEVKKSADGEVKWSITVGQTAPTDSPSIEQRPDGSMAARLLMLATDDVSWASNYQDELAAQLATIHGSGELGYYLAD